MFDERKQPSLPRKPSITERVLSILSTGTRTRAASVPVRSSTWTANEVKGQQASQKREKLHAKRKVKWLALLAACDKDVSKRKGFRSNKQVRNLCFAGIPTSLRNRVWPLLMGNDLQLTGEVYQAISEDVAVLVSKYITRRAAKEAALQKIYDERQELRLALAGIKQLPLVSHTLIVEFLTGPEVASSNGNGNGNGNGSRGSGEKAAPVRSSQEIKYDRGIEEIEQDVLRTFPQLKFFHAPDGLLYRPFLTVLQSYSCFRPQIGYVQGMSYIVSMLLLNVDESEAFLILSNLMEIDNTRDFFTFEQEAMTREPACFNLLLASRLSKVAKHFDREGIHPSMYLFEWIMTMFSRSLSLEVSFRIWDSFLLLGYPFLLRTALGLIRMYRTELCASSFELILPLLQRPPQDMDVDVLFDHIRQIKPITEKELKATRTKANGLNH